MLTHLVIVFHRIDRIKRGVGGINMLKTSDLKESDTQLVKKLPHKTKLKVVI